MGSPFLKILHGTISFRCLEPYIYYGETRVFIAHALGHPKSQTRRNRKLFLKRRDY